MEVPKATNMDLVPAEPKETKQATRPVNCFMMFRSKYLFRSLEFEEALLTRAAYYSTMFGNAHQKEISGVITFLWQHDANHNMWIILAKAYSIIRDAQGKAMSPIEVFLIINAPFVNVPPPGDYLRAMGWAISDGNEASIIRKGAVDSAFTQTHHSVLDVVQHSIEAGYVIVKSLSQKQFDLMMVLTGGKMTIVM